MTILHHPAFQSLGLPLLLTVSLTLLLGMLKSPAALRGWAIAGAAGLLLSYLLLPGYDWPATARVQKLPWIVLAGTGLAMIWQLRDLPGGRWKRWALGASLWALACTWLTGQPDQWLYTALGTLGGAIVLAWLLLPVAPAQPDNGAAAAGALTVASLGLAAVAGGGGSLLLAQLAMMLAVSTAVPGLWAWLRQASGQHLPRVALLPLTLAWLVMAYALALPGLAASGRVSLMALALAVPVWLNRTAWAARHPRWVPLLSALLAAMPVAAALAWLLLGESIPAGAEGVSEGTSDDPYYEPDWN